MCELKGVPDSFHSRYSALYREYTYLIHNSERASPFLYRYSWWVGTPLDIGLMRLASQQFVGYKDFSFVANEPAEKDCRRVVYFLRVSRKRGFVVVHIRANAFLRGMVRNIVGLLVAFGTKRLKMDMSGNIIDRQAEIKAYKAPPEGLFLSRVVYPEGGL